MNEKYISWGAVAIAVVALLLVLTGRSAAPHLLGSAADATFGPLNTTSTNVMVAATANGTTLLPVNGGRVYVSFCNNGSSTVYLGMVTSTASPIATTTGITLYYGTSTGSGVSGSCWTQAYPTIFTGVFKAVSGGVSSSIGIIEGSTH